MYIKKIKLELEDLTHLLSKGECECVVSESGAIGKVSDLRLGTTYELHGAKGFFVRVCRNDGHKVLLCKNEGVLTNTPREKSIAMRKVDVCSRLDNGMFVGGKSRFNIGEEVAVAEDYFNLCQRVGREYMKEIAKAHRLEDIFQVKSLAGWNNKKLVLAEVMPRRIEVVSCELKRVRDISDREWFLLGVDWVNSDMEIDRKVRCVGRVAFDNNTEVMLYRYKTLKGSVQTDRDLTTYKDRCPWMFESK